MADAKPRSGDIDPSMQVHQRSAQLAPVAAPVDAEPEHSDAEEERFNVQGTTTISFAHFAHDIYSSFTAVLIPPVQEKLGIPLAIAALMVPAQQMPSVLQPFIGVVADRTSKRWFVVLAPAVAALSVSSIGLAPHFAVVLLLLLTAGLASAAFHTPAVALSGEFGGSKMGLAMAMFMAGGQLARALGPLLITAAIAWFTLEGSFVIVVIGLAASVALFFTLDTTASDAAGKSRPHVPLRPLLRSRLRWLSALLAFGTFRGFGMVPFSIFLVAYLLEKGHGEWYAGFSLSVLLGAGVIGGFVGGVMSDRMDRRVVLLLTTVTSVPLLYLYLWLEGDNWLVLLFLFAAGVVTMSPRPIQLALAQEMFPEARGPAAGIMLAFGFVTMSLTALAFGSIADSIGIETAMWFAPAASLLSVPAIAFMPGPKTVIASPADE